MFSTAKVVIENLLGLVEDIGFVPNGSRAYYTNRSQPPFLSLMVAEFVSVIKAKCAATAMGMDMEAFVSKTVSVLDMEYGKPRMRFCLLELCYTVI